MPLSRAGAKHGVAAKPVMAVLDPQALAQHIDRLYRAAWALCGSRPDAEDLVQETFARVLAKPREVRPGQELAYLLTALRNAYVSGRRAESARPRSVADVEALPLADSRSSGDPQQALAARQVFSEIAELPIDLRLALVAVDVAGLSYAEAADLLSTREATIATRLFRARGRLALALDGPQKDAATAGRQQTDAAGEGQQQSTRLMEQGSR